MMRADSPIGPILKREYLRGTKDAVALVRRMWGDTKMPFKLEAAIIAIEALGKIERNSAE